MSTKKKPLEKSGEYETTVSATFKKALRTSSDWPDKDEFLDVIYWLRQILGVILGVMWGIAPLSGVIGLILFFLINCAIVFVYYNIIQRIDEEKFGGFTELMKEGLMTSLSTFLVMWIIVYSATQISA